MQACASQQAQPEIDWKQQQSDAEPDSSSLGSEDQEESDTESEQLSRSFKGQRRRRVVGAGAADTQAAAGVWSAQQALHAPYSNLLWWDSVVEQSRFKVASSLCTDIAGVSSSSSSSGSGSAAMQVTVKVHTASWDMRQ